jgi:hypothetical protein
MELGSVLAEARGPRAPVIIVGGVFLVLLSLFGFATPAGRGTWVFGLAVPGVAVMVVGARRPVVRFHERGLTRGRKRMSYESVRSVSEGNPLLHQPGMVKGRGLVRAVDAQLMLGDGSPWSVVRLERTPEVYAVLEQRVLPALVARWRARLEGGETYKLGGTAVLELTKNELWVPDPRNPMRPLLVPFREIQISGAFVYRRTGGDALAAHGALASDLVLRELLRGSGVPVT